ncbi:ATPase AAA [Cellulomonas chitinilytica]|uniref:ATPase AAA n=1 Tax=Cellulomonas chitinilytica TaxID=398759 RepID=A0A919P2J1_9CELL|nr:fibronectin type III domain-containing protein [Cellulomonas chitinilytica]GIG19934.1 ATPase AAA [Cellulomonas chitinilytica]
MSWRALRSRSTKTAAVVTVPVVVAVLALVHPGFPLARLDLNDGAVWLTATSQLKVGRFNVPVEELNAGLVTEGGDSFDVLQDEGDVLLVERDTVSVVDPASVALTTPVPAAGTVVSMAAGTVSFVDGAGDAWVRTVAQLGGLQVAQDRPDLALGDGGAVVVARSGAALGVAPEDGAVTRVDVSSGDAQLEELGSLGAGDVDQLTAVGDEPVVLSGSTLRTLHGSVELTGDGLTLQQAGPEASSVLVASRTALLEVPLDGGRVVEHQTGGDGAPAAPVRVGRCAHGAWASSTGSYVELCEGKKPRLDDLEDMSSTDVLKFRVNRQMVVLNDTLRGRLWMPTQDTDLRVPNWQDIQPQEEPEESDEQSDSPDTTQELVTECTDQSAPPTAADDEFGVRPGRTTILPVIDNDSSSDCGILAISQFDPLPPEFGHLESIYGGRALQVVVASDATGSADLTYTITDGRGTSAPSTAHVHLTVRGDGEQGPPVQLRTGSVEVEQGGQAEHDALADFTDPDGDDLLLVGATADAEAGSVQFRQDGAVTFKADGTKLGRTRVTLQVSDGTSVVEGTLDVDVRAAGSLSPQIDPVHAVTYVNQPVTVNPLAAVRSTGREPARLASVDEVAGATTVADLNAGTFTFQAARPGPYYVPFVIAAGPQQATGLARVDVREWPEQAEPPVAVRDLALLPAGGEVTVDPLDNDSDPAGKVLVLLSIDGGDSAGLKVAILDHHLVQIRAQRTLEGPVALRYVVSNGAAEAIGEIVVHPVPPTATSQPPVVKDIEVSVRTGGVVTIPALESAYDPDGDHLTLERELAEPLGPGEGLLFVSGDVLRYQAPDAPLTAHATFSVRDSTGNKTAAQVTVRVHASDAATKSPPRPRDLVERVFAGDTVRIDVPLVGIDPDGDGVTLLGVAQAPVHGRVTTVGADYLLYESIPGESGTDTFTYAVEDWAGQRAVATIRVGIAKRPTGAASVVARDDAVTVTPGQTVEVRVLANDVDSSGDELELAPDLEMPEGTDAKVDSRRIIVHAPDEATVIQIAYTAQNSRGGRDSAVLTITVTDDAPVQPPIARDVVVPATDTIGRSDVSVDVLAVAQNPSGPLSDLAVSVPRSVADVAQVTPDGHVLVTLVDHTQTLPYLLTNTTAPDATSASSYAFITVPALGFFRPTVRPNAPELRVASGEKLVIPLDEQVKVAPGKKASVKDPVGVTATKSDGTNLVADSHTLQFTSAPGYAGPASISLEVTDAAGAGDTSANSSFITLPIEVYAVDDHPPTFTPSTIDVAPGEAPISVDLRSFTTGPEGQTSDDARYTYQIASAIPDGFVVELDKSVLKVSADVHTPKGRTDEVDLRIGYGRTGSLDAAVSLRVIASTRAVARVEPQEQVGVEGRETTFDVLGHAWNPFPEPLTLLGATVETPGAGTASTAGGSVSVRPAVGFIGRMVTRVRVRDVTGDPDREVEARVTVVVRGRPAQPTSPKVLEVRDRTVVLQWDAPDNRGAEITGYRVVASPGGITRQCASTTCTIDNLTNDVEYTFTVAAQNAVDLSDPSSPSAPARPDAVPDAPTAPTLEFGDRSITATWPEPTSPGSPVTSYTVEISPLPLTGGGSTTVSTPRATFTGLRNGTAYTVRVRAHNKAPDPSSWSPFSQPMSPAAVPDAPAVTATRSTTGWFGDARIDVSWTPPANNGDAVQGYELTVDGGAPVALGADVTTYAIAPAQRGHQYQVVVRARNKAGWSAPGSATGETVSAPTAPQSVTLAVPAGDTPAWGQGRVDLTWQAPAETGGAGITIARYVVTGPGYSTQVPGTTRSVRIEGLAAGTSGPFTVTAVSSRDDMAGDPATSGSVLVQTAPQKPQASATSAGVDQVNLTFTDGADGASPITAREYWVNGTVTTTQPDSPYTSTSRVNARFRVQNKLGWSDWSDTASAQPGQPTTPGAPTISVATGSPAGTVTFSWAAPTNNGGRAVNGYDWEVVSVADGSTLKDGHTNATPSPITVDKLKAGDVLIRVTASNPVGSGPPAEVRATVA